MLFDHSLVELSKDELCDAIFEGGELSFTVLEAFGKDYFEILSLRGIELIENSLQK